MRRVLWAIIGTVAGTLLLVGLKAPWLGSPTPIAATAPLDPAAPGAAPGASGPVLPGTTGPATTAPATKPTPAPTAAVPGQPTTAPAGGSGTATGTATKPPPAKSYAGMAVAVRTAQSPTSKSSACGECHDYTISVTITVSGGRITGSTVSYNTSPGGSQSYANRANSTLSQSILPAQTWNLGRVSGATYAGNAWETSVRDAMSKAGLPV